MVAIAKRSGLRGTPPGAGPLVAAIALAAALSGCGPAVDAQDDPAAALDTAPPATVPPAPPRSSSPSSPDHEAAQPVAVHIPAIEAAAELQPLGLLASGELAPPEYGWAGWWEPGPEPGEVGPAVIAGHLDSADGPDVFWRLAELAPGDAVQVERADGTTVTFHVTSVEHHPQASFPTDRVYGAVDAPALRLITCGGDYDRSAGRYLDNVVVFAEPAPVG